MSTANEAWLSLFLVTLFGLLFVLRIKFPNPSRGAETAILVSGAIAFFFICNVFLSRSKASTQTVPQIIQAQWRIEEVAR